MLKGVTDKSTAEYQRMTWDALKKSINGLINKVNVSNISNILPELFAENLIRGRGLLCRSLMKAQAASPTFTRVYAALVAVINTKLPQIGELLLHRLIVQFRRAFQRNDKTALLASTRFIAHLVNQQVSGEILALEILALLLERPTDDSVEVAVGFAQECGYTLQELSPQGFTGMNK
jgi:pre-mRNA-splicing factor CWC22